MHLTITNALPGALIASMGPHVGIVPVSPEQASALLHREGITWSSAVGHADTARLLSGLIGLDIPENRVSLAWCPDLILLAGLYVGPRLPEGARTLPEGARIDLYLVSPAWIREGTCSADGLQRESGYLVRGSAPAPICGDIY